MRYNREQLSQINEFYEKRKHKLEEIKEKEAEELVAFYKGLHNITHNKPGYKIEDVLDKSKENPNPNTY